MGIDRDQLDKPIRKLRKVLKKMAGEPAPKQVHDLRTNSRRLEATLQAIDPDQNERKILTRVSRLRKSAGKVRDMDVLTGYAAELTPSGTKTIAPYGYLSISGPSDRRKPGSSARLCGRARLTFVSG